MKASHKRKAQTVAQRVPLNELVATAIVAVKELQEVGGNLMTSAAPITSLRKESVPSLAQLARDLKDLAEHLSLRAELVGKTLDSTSSSLNIAGQGIQRIGNTIRKQLSDLDVQLSTEKQFSRYLT